MHTSSLSGGVLKLVLIAGYPSLPGPKSHSYPGPHDLQPDVSTESLPPLALLCMYFLFLLLLKTLKLLPFFVLFQLLYFFLPLLEFTAAWPLGQPFLTWQPERTLSPPSDSLVPGTDQHILEKEPVLQTIISSSTFQCWTSPTEMFQGDSKPNTAKSLSFLPQRTLNHVSSFRFDQSRVSTRRVPEGNGSLVWSKNVPLGQVPLVGLELDTYYICIFSLPKLYISQ